MTETLSLCKHGVPNKFGCLTCFEESNLDERITDLENINIELRLLKLEEIIGMMNDNVGKLPYKCPICEGRGFWSGIREGMQCGGQCHACDGKGIFWN